MSNEKDAIRIDPAVQQFAEMLISAFGPVAKVMAAPDDNIVNMSMTREAFEKQRADLAELDQLRKQVADLQSRVDVAEKNAAEEQRRAAKAIDANRLYARRVASLQGQIRAAGAHATRAEYNKLWKQHTACKNQRDSYAATIATKDKVIADLNATIANLKQRPQVPCAVMIIDSITYTPEEVKKIVAVSADRARTIERLTNDLTTMTRLRDNAVKSAENLLGQDNQAVVKQLRDKDSQIGHLNKLYQDTLALNERLRSDLEHAQSQIKTFYFNGKVISDERLKQLCDLGGAAEEAGFDKGYFNALIAAAKQNNDAVQPSAVVYDHRRRVNDGGDEIVVRDIENVRFQLYLDANRVLSIDASLIPQMAQDIQARQNQANTLEGSLSKCMERNNQQAAALRAAEKEMESLRSSVGELSKRVSDKDADIQRLTIERNLIRGQLNELRALKTPARVNGQVLEAGEAYMTTALGMLPINAEGMRKLSDTLDAYRAKITSLTSGLREWIKS